MAGSLIHQPPNSVDRLKWQAVFGCAKWGFPQSLFTSPDRRPPRRCAKSVGRAVGIVKKYDSQLRLAPRDRRYMILDSVGTLVKPQRNQ